MRGGRGQRGNQPSNAIKVDGVPVKNVNGATRQIYHACDTARSAFPPVIKLPSSRKQLLLKLGVFRKNQQRNGLFLAHVSSGTSS